MRGDMGTLAGRTGASPWSDLPVSGQAGAPEVDSMMSTEVNERLKKDTQYVSVRENTEDKVRWMGLKAVLDERTNETRKRDARPGRKVQRYLYTFIMIRENER